MTQKPDKTPAKKKAKYHRPATKTALAKRCKALDRARETAENDAAQLVNDLGQARSSLRSTEAALRTFTDQAAKEKTRADKAENKVYDQRDKIDTLTAEVRSLRSEVASQKVVAERIAAWEQAKQESRVLHSEASRENVHLRREKARVNLMVLEAIEMLGELDNQQAELVAAKLRKI